MNPRPGRLALSLLALLFAQAALSQAALSQSSDSIQGIVYAVPGQDASNTVVIACVVVKDECSDTLSKLTVIKDSGPSVPYRLEGLGAGPFLLIAWRDLNGTSALDAGDEVGVHSRDGKTPTPVTPPASRIDLRLKAFSGDLDSLLAKTEDLSQAQPFGSIVGDWSTVELFADTVNENTGSYTGGNNSFTAAKFDASGKRLAWPRITVRLNGVVIHDQVELAKDFTTSAPISTPLDGPEGPLHLQQHQNPVAFRNIWLVPGK